jgi:hypothetical protein
MWTKTTPLKKGGGARRHSADASPPRLAARHARLRADSARYAEQRQLCRDVEARAVDARPDRRSRCRCRPTCTACFRATRFWTRRRAVAKLRRVLSTYFARNSTIAYCAALPLIAGVLTCCSSPRRRRFSCSSMLVEQILPSQYYTANMCDIRVDCRVLSALVQERLPKLALHIAKTGAQQLVESVFVQWLLCLFVVGMPTETTLRIWDCLLCGEGNPVLLRMAVALLKLNEAELLATDDPESLDAAALRSAEALFRRRAAVRHRLQAHRQVRARQSQRHARAAEARRHARATPGNGSSARARVGGARCRRVAAAARHADSRVALACTISAGRRGCCGHSQRWRRCCKYCRVAVVANCRCGRVGAERRRRRNVCQQR